MVYDPSKSELKNIIDSINYVIQSIQNSRTITDIDIVNRLSNVIVNLEKMNVREEMK